MVDIYDFCSEGNLTIVSFLPNIFWVMGSWMSVQIVSTRQASDIYTFLTTMVLMLFDFGFTFGCIVS